MRIAIESDGRTVWVHRGGETIGRFGRFGIDVHSTLQEQMEGASQCKCCTHGPTSSTHWELFKAAMLQYHEVIVGNEYMPIRLQGSAASLDRCI